MKEEKADFLKITKSSLQAFFHIPLHLFFEIREACVTPFLESRGLPLPANENENEKR